LNIITIKDQEMYKDFMDFMNDPEVVILKEEAKSDRKIYDFNTGDRIIVPNKLGQPNKLDKPTDSDDVTRLIFGKDPTPNITNISIENNIVYKFFNNGSMEYEDYKPWVLTPRKYTLESKRLKGDQYFKYMTPLDEIDYNQIGWNRDIWRPRRLEEGYLLQSGATYYKGMKIEDLNILFFDIETNGLAIDNNSKTFIISNTFRKEGKITRKLFSVNDYATDQDMIRDWCEWVVDIDPSIMCGHNIYSYDFQFLTKCLGEDLPIGKDRRPMKNDEKTSKFRKDGSQQYEYYNARIFGREIIDTFFLSIKYDIGREFPSYGLKPIIKHLGKEKAGRQFYDAGQIAKNWDNPEERKKIITYAIEDSDDAMVLFDIMAPSFFYLTQSIPKSFQQMINEATGGQLDSFMIRGYLQDGYSQPRSSQANSYEGAISMGIPGIYENAVKVDVASLYPSIMLQYDISDNVKDPNKHMLRALRYFRDQRLKNKKLAKDTKEKYYDDLQGAQKILINSLYGFLGANFVLYNYPKGAERVTKHGRDILLKAVEWATGHTMKKAIKNITNKGKVNEEISYEWVLGDKNSNGNGYTLINTDTDSFTATKGKFMTSTEFEDDLKALNSIYPELITWENDGQYDKFIVFKAKNYVKQIGDKIKYTGSGLNDKKKEYALQELLKTCINEFLVDNTDIQFIYKKYVNEALNISDINRWTVKKTITKKLLESDRKTESKVRDALEGEILQEGDKVWVYAAIDGEIQDVVKGEPQFYKKTGLPKMIENKILKTPDKWVQDDNKFHYAQRVYTALELFSDIIDMNQYVEIKKKDLKVKG